MTENAREIFDRIPALKALTGVARIEAEQVIENALTDAVQDFILFSEPNASDDAAKPA